MGIRSFLQRILKTKRNVPIWQPALGRKYKDYWTSMSDTEELAILATYGKIAPEEERIESCRYIADYILRALEIDDTKNVLEVGCGMGMFARLVGSHCRRYTGADISPNMVAWSRRFTRNLPNVDFQVLERSDLAAFPDASFDAVFFEAVLMHMAREDTYNYLCEAHRVLKPGGRVYASFKNILHPDSFRHFLSIAKSADRTGEYGVGRARFHSATELRQFAVAAGFRIDEQLARLQPVENDPALHEVNTLTIVGVKGEKPAWALPDTPAG